MENKDNIREPEIQILEIGRVMPQLIKRVVSDTYRGSVVRPAFNSTDSDENLRKLRRLGYLT